MTREIRAMVCLENEDGAEFRHQIGILYRPPSCHDLISMLHGLASRVLGMWRGHGAGVFLSSIEFEGEARSYDIRARNPSGRHFNGTFAGVDEDIADFHARWAMAKEAGLPTTVDDLRAFSTYMENVQVDGIEPSGRIVPIEALADIHRALESGEGLAEAREKVRAALEQAGYPVADTSAPGIR